MPKKLHQALERQARKMHLTGDRKNAYVYGTLRKVEKQRVAKRHRRQHR